MPRIAKALSDTEVRAAKPRDKSHKLADGGGMYLLVQPTGGKLWRMDYAFAGRRKTLALGAYPDVSLKDARKRREDAREMLANGIDPGEAKRARKAAVYGRAANSFEAVAREWFHVWKQDKAETHHTKVISRLEHDVFPFLGGRPIREIDAPEILGVLRRIASRGTLDTAHRAGGNCSQVFRYAVATGKASRNPVPDLKGALPSVTKEHYPAITDRAKVGELLRAIGAYNGNPNVVAALNLLPLLFVRPGELRKMRWAELDLEKAEWKYFVTKTKTNHLVPLAKQAVEILEDLRARNGGKELVFPGLVPGKPFSDNTLNAALRRLGYDTKTEHCAHGFRATARTLMAEDLRIPAEVIEHQLAHRVPDALGVAYNRTKFLDDRIEAMQKWADHLDNLKAGADVVPLRA